MHISKLDPIQSVLSIIIYWSDSPLVYCLNILPPFWILNRNVLSGNKWAYIHLYVILRKMFTFIWSTCVKFKVPSAGLLWLLLTINWLELDRSEAFLCTLISSKLWHGAGAVLNTQRYEAARNGIQPPPKKTTVANKSGSVSKEKQRLQTASSKIRPV